MKHKCLYHNYLFLFGTLYYLILPLIIVSNNYLSDYAGMRYLYIYYDVDIYFVYLLIVVLFVISFYIGSCLPLHYVKNSNSNQCKHFNFDSISDRDLLLISSPFWIYGQFVILKNLNNLFQGYAVEYDVVFMGTISTLNLLFLFLFLYQRLKGVRSRKILYNMFIPFSLVEFSVVLLGQGSRMYIMIPFIACIIYMLDNSIIGLKKLCVWGCIGIIFFLFIGIWRLGGNNMSIEVFMYIGVAEPAFTWISLVSMFSLNSLPLLAFPSNFISSFYNFIPTFLFPNKESYFIPLSLEYTNPLGATNLLVSIISNFGILGGCFILFLLGFLLTFIQFNLKGLFGKTYYYCICGIIPFQLFRDSFPIINKMFFINLFLIPFALILAETFLCRISKKQ